MEMEHLKITAKKSGGFCEENMGNFQPDEHDLYAEEAAAKDEESDAESNEMLDYSSILSSSSIIPRRGIKSFEPLANLPLSQSLALRKSLSAMHAAIQAPAAFHSMKNTSLAVAGSLSGAQVEFARGTHWMTMGKVRNGCMSVSPEELLYLTERRSLIVTLKDENNIQSPMSVQGVYAHSLLPGGGAYNVYAILKRFGYTVGRFDHLNDKPPSAILNKRNVSWFWSRVKYLIAWIRGAHSFSDFNLNTKSDSMANVLKSLPHPKSCDSSEQPSTHVDVTGIGGCVAEWAVCLPRPNFKKSHIQPADHEVIVLDPFTKHGKMNEEVGGLHGNIPSLAEWKVLLQRRSPIQTPLTSVAPGTTAKDRINRIKAGDPNFNKIVAIWDEGVVMFTQIALTDMSKEPIYS